MTYLASFRVDGMPKAQPRARAFARRFGNKFSARVYDPGTAEGWKAAVVAAARSHRPASPLEGAICFDVDLFFARPKSLCRRRDPDGPIAHLAKPDRDNCEKALLDALKQDGWFRDDSQVCDGRVRKFYAAKDGRPGAQITVREMAREEIA
ncbi:MAG: RusA family crossover junction endodeoxyribonuclease [Planctomycetes bacterium]|nr:RusA family crossover junction endodeoxyribonuclease [Planctomycetota bacterium]